MYPRAVGSVLAGLVVEHGGGRSSQVETTVNVRGSKSLRLDSMEKAMTWQLAVSLLVSVPAIITGFGACIYYRLRRVKSANKIKQMLRDHVDSNYNRCRFCAYMHKD